ncbi:hypothetical protein F66182_7596 [Fusarium sp. NRRL 66182]|nr:hypothetical protein F66182_7596 [Fusarium sp. NRRL 66182]
MPSVTRQDQIVLVPWDPNSSEHVERLFEQRVQCGWHKWMVDEWREKQTLGVKSIFWITLRADDVATQGSLQLHLDQFPAEKEPLADTATSLRAKPRSPTHAKFYPIGHISLDDTDKQIGSLGLDLPEQGLYWIKTFYVSKALRSKGIGRAAMDIVEAMAIDEPLYAKTLALDTAEKQMQKRLRLEETGKEPSTPIPSSYNRPLPLQKILEALVFPKNNTPKQDMTSDAVLDICAYHRRDFDLVLVRSRPHETQTVLRDLQTAFKDPAASGLGVLGRLPLELLWIVFRNLDLLSYFRFRHVNRQARALSTALPEYQAVVKYGLEGLRGMLRAGLAQTFTIQHLYNALICEKCLGFLSQASAEELRGRSEQTNQRFMASTAFPWYNPDSKRVESGYVLSQIIIHSVNMILAAAAERVSKVFGLLTEDWPMAWI